jgi:nucleoside-diphosphate-sugar epimerase
VCISSETVPGHLSAERDAQPDYLPIDEQHPVRPQDAYALSKAVGESICGALVRRSDASAVSIRPSLVLASDDYPRVVPRFRENPMFGKFNAWSYVDVEDLAALIALAAEASSAGHEVVYAAQPDNLVGRSFAELVDLAYGERAPQLRLITRDDGSGIDCTKARELFGWEPTISWRDRILI